MRLDSGDFLTTDEPDLTSVFGNVPSEQIPPLGPALDPVKANQYAQAGDGVRARRAWNAVTGALGAVGTGAAATYFMSLAVHRPYDSPIPIGVGIVTTVLAGAAAVARYVADTTAVRGYDQLRDERTLNDPSIT